MATSEDVVSRFKGISDQNKFNLVPIKIMIAVPFV